MPRFAKKLVHWFAMLCCAWITAPAQDIILPAPQRSGGLPLMDALNNRQSTRSFSNQELPPQVLSDLLWTAYGFNRPEQKGRTVPSAYNIQNMSVYAALASGLYLYDAENNTLKLVVSRDVRSETGTQDFCKTVPLNLVYVADLGQMARTGDRASYYSIAHAGFIAQNVYLYCASANLGCVVRDLIDRETLKNTLSLTEDQEIILAQSVGYPQNASQVGQAADEKPDEQALRQNFPNPFNAETSFAARLTGESFVTVAIFDANGRRIRQLTAEKRAAGEHLFSWDGLNDQGQPMASGVYFYQLDINEQAGVTRKMIMLK